MTEEPPHGKSARQERLLNINRIMTRPIKDVDRAIRDAEELIVQLADEMNRLQEAKDSEWWHCQDMIDDAYDLLDFLTTLSPRLANA